jgi:hypothetical protein
MTRTKVTRRRCRSEQRADTPPCRWCGRPASFGVLRNDLVLAYGCHDCAAQARLTAQRCGYLSTAWWIVDPQGRLL